MAKPVGSYLPPAGPLNATLITWECGREMHRVHDDAYLGDQFNPNSMEERPLQSNPRYRRRRHTDALRRHDPRLRTYGDDLSRSSLQDQLQARLEAEDGTQGPDHPPTCDRPAPHDLSTIALHKLGIDRAHLIDTTKAQYPRTRGWAEALYSQFPDAQGLSWSSRRHDHAQAVMLFRTRVKTSDLTIARPSTVLLEDSNAILPVVDLAIKLGATLVD